MKRSRHKGRKVDISRREGESTPEYRYRMRLLVIRHYMNGRKIGCQCEGCRCTGDRYLPFLQLDHVKGTGASHVHNGRRLRGFDLVMWIIRRAFPRGMFSVKCANCNSSKNNKGRCALYGTRH
jgi:hypothetical protein